MTDKIIELFLGAGIEISSDEASRLNDYMKGILKYNQDINLTAITDEKDFISKHFVDSASIIKLDEYKAAEKVIDVGTGAGFPGIPLAVLSSDKSFTLFDSLQKKLKIVDELAARIGIDNIITLHGRAEDIGKDKNYRETYDLCVSRAVANMAVLAEYCLPLVKVGGYLIAYKGPEADNELAEARNAIRILGGRYLRTETVKTADYNHKILIIKKENITPDKYPRRAGKPGKSPIK